MANEVLFWHGDKTSALAAGRVLGMDNVNGGTAATGTLTNNGTNVVAGDTVTIDQEVYNFVAALTEAAADGQLLGTGVAPTAGDTVTLDSQTYTFVTALTEALATGTLTGNGTNVANGDTVTINGVVYTFETTLTNAAGNVHIGSTAALSLTNLFYAINAAGGTVGTDYAADCVANPNVIATNPSGTTVVVTARAVGVTANLYATTTTSANVAWGGATMAGGVNSVANQVVIGNATQSLTHLYEAIDGGANIGVDYSSATATNPTISATNPSATTVDVAARAVGTNGNDLVTTVVSAANVMAFVVTSAGTNTTLANGVDSVANEVLVGGSNTASMTHLYEAINAGANAGTDYSTATLVHPTVSATNPSGTTVVLSSIGEPQSGNGVDSIVTTETSANLSFGAATLAGGSDADVLIDPVTGFPRYQTYALVTPAAPSGAIAFDLPKGDEAQEVFLWLKTKAGGDAVVSGAFAGGDTTLTFSAAGQYAKLKFLNGSWLAMSNTGALSS